MKSIIKFSINNKFALWIMTVIILFAGLYSGMNMKMETLPDVTIPIVSVTTVYPGASPEQVMDKVTKPIEQRTRNLGGVDSVTSTSYENASSVVLQYDYGTDMEKAQEEVKSVLGDVTLPDGVRSPDVSRISLNAFPVISLSVSGEETDLAELTKLVENEIVPKLEGLTGVGSVQVSGQNVTEGELAFKADKLAQYGLSEDTVKGIIQSSAMSAPLGIYEFGASEKSLLVDGNIVSEEDLNELEIPYNPSGNTGAGTAPGTDAAAGAERMPGAGAGLRLPTVKLGELADLKIVGKAESVSRTNGRESIGLSVVKSADANTVDVVNAVKGQMDELKKDHPDLSVITTLDQGEPIEDSVHTMISKAVFGGLIAILIILIFLRNIRSTIIAVVSIPLSILIALLVLSQMDVTLNVMTLGAMTVAIGRVIDDSIVVVENIYRRMGLTGEKLKGRQLIMEATREMFIPILSSTIVTVAVFLPLALVTGMIGEIFMPFALTIVFALLASLVVAVTVVPMLAHTMFRGGIRGGRSHEERPGRIAERYKSVLRWSLNHKAVTFGLAVLLLVGSLFLLPVIGVSFLPSEEQKSMVVTYDPAPGETLDQVKKLALKVESELQDRSGLEVVQYSVGGSNPMNPGATKQALFNLSYYPDKNNFDQEKENVLRLLQGLGAKGEFKEQNIAGGGIGGSSLVLNVFGPDMTTVRPVVEEVRKKLEDNGHLDNVDSSLSETYEQYRLVADQEKLSRYGLTAGQVAMALTPAQKGDPLTTIVKDGEELGVFVKTEPKSYESKEDLENVALTSQLGIPVPLKDVVKVEEGETPNTITRMDDRIYAEVSADVTSSDVGSVSSELQEQIDAMDLPAGVSVEMGGITEDINESFTQLGLAMLAAIAIVYLVLVITFGGAITPFVILFSLPFTVIGALLGLFIAGETLSVTALIGALMLIGIVVTNGIVFVDRVIHKEREGLSVREALLEAAGTRLRPILMTAIATVGAMIPLALGFESGGLISKGMAITVIGGLISSTLLTLIIVPIVYEFLNRRKKPRAARDLAFDRTE